MLRNEHIHIELYLHKLISPLLTCLVTKKLGNSPAEHHWALRQAAAKVIALICKLYGSKYPNLQQRISKQLVKALTDPDRPLTTRFGRSLPVSGNFLRSNVFCPYSSYGLISQTASTEFQNMNCFAKTVGAPRTLLL